MPLAIARASASAVKRVMVTTGPKTSSRAIRASGADVVEDGGRDEVAAGQVGGAGAAEDEAGIVAGAPTMCPVTFAYCASETIGPRSRSSRPAPTVMRAARALRRSTKLVGDARLDQELGRGRADLAGIAEGTVDHVLDQARSRSASAKTRTAFLPPSSSTTGMVRSAAIAMIARPVGDRAGEGDAAHQRVADQRRARLLAVAGDDVEHAGRQAGLQRQLGQAQSRERRLLGGFEHGRAAGGESRGQRAGGHAERVVPGDDVGGDAQRLQQREVDHAGPSGMVAPSILSAAPAL